MDLDELDARTLLRLHADSQQLIDAALADLRPADLQRPTPCRDWELRALLEHIHGQNLGLAAAARGAGPELTGWRPRALGPHPVQVIAASSHDLVAALAERRLTGELWMPEISPAATLPVRRAVLAHLVDTVVHGWDVAVTLGRAYSVPVGQLQVAAAVSARIPTDESRLRPGAAFAPAIAPTGEGALAVLLAQLGRSYEFDQGHGQGDGAVSEGAPANSRSNS